MRSLSGLSLVLSLVIRCSSAAVITNSNSSTPMKHTAPGPPIPPPSYMVDNSDNHFGAAPDGYEPHIEMPAASPVLEHNLTIPLGHLESRQSTSYWLANMKHGQARFSLHHVPDKQTGRNC